MSLPVAKSTVMLTLALGTLFGYLHFLSLKSIRLHPSARSHLVVTV